MRTTLLAFTALALTVALAACSSSRPPADTPAVPDAAAGAPNTGGSPDTDAAEARVAALRGRADAIRRGLDFGTAARSFGDDPIAGEIADGDALMDGQPFDAYAVELTPGARFTADLRSDDFETFMVVLPPTGPEVYSDYPGLAEDDLSFMHARVEMTAEEEGTYLLLVMPLNDGDTGAYTLDVSAPGDVLAVPPEMLME